MKRRTVHKGKSARKFRKDVSRTVVKNMVKPGRGGYRL